MKLFLVVCIGLVLIGCSYDHPKNAMSDKDTLAGYTKRIIPLENELGKVEIYLPEELDTSYHWVAYNDCGKCCDEYHKYRFTSRTYSSLAETGFFYLKQPDSVYQFTVWHFHGKDCFNTYYSEDRLLSGITSSIIERNKTYNNEGYLKWYRRQIKQINGRKFVIAAYSDKSERIKLDEVQKIRVITQLKKELLTMEFECNACDCSGFLERMLPALETLKIDTVPSTLHMN